MPWQQLWPCLTACAAAAAVWGLTAFVAAHRLGRINIIETLWPFGFLLIALVGLATTLGRTGDVTRQVLLLVLTVVWAVRLGVYVGRGQGDDPRYVKLLDRGNDRPVLKSVAYVFAPQTQTLVLFLVSLTLQISPVEHGRPGPLLVLGIVVWALGLVFEAVGDQQMRNFRADPANRGTIIRSGLWRYTGHPNYFGDAAVWVGLWLLGAPTIGRACSPSCAPL